MFKWVGKNPDLKKSLENWQLWTPEQQLKVSEYMVNNAYFQEQFLKQMLLTSENSWTAELEPEQKLNYLKILAGLNEDIK